MKIGVLADTHVTRSTGMVQTLKQTLRNKRTIDDLRVDVMAHFQGVELILHAGDFTDSAVIEMLQTIAPVEGVCGNMDAPEIARCFPAKRIVELGGFRIGLIHGSGAPQGIAERVLAQFEMPVDAIVFGHSHQPFHEMRGAVLLFNPGSPTDRVFAPYNSLGVLEITDRLTATLIRL